MPRTHRIFCHCGMDVVVWEHKHFPDLYHLFIMVSQVTDLALDFNIFQSFVEVFFEVSFVEVLKLKC